MRSVPTINTTLDACEGLDVVVAMVVSPRPERAGQADQDGRPSGAARAWRLIFQLSEVSVPRWLFQGVLDRIGRLSPAPS